MDGGLSQLVPKWVRLEAASAVQAGMKTTICRYKALGMDFVSVSGRALGSLGGPATSLRHPKRQEGKSIQRPVVSSQFCVFDFLLAALCRLHSAFRLPPTGFYVPTSGFQIPDPELPYSSSVDRSPVGRPSSQAFKTRRMILPLRVLGSFSLNSISRGAACTANFCRTNF